LRKTAFAIKNSPTIILPKWNSILEQMAVVSKEKGETPLGIRMMPRDVSTRWNSTFDMLNFAVTYRRALESLTGTLGMGLRVYELSDEDWDIAKDLRDTLEVSLWLIPF
jgi:hypothetical protein